MNRQLFIIGLLVVAASAVNLKNLQRRTRRSAKIAPLSVAEVPSSFLEAGYPDESFHAWKHKQSNAAAQLTAPSAPNHRQVITKFNQVEFFDHGYEFEPMYADDSFTSLLETSTSEQPALVPDFHKDTHYVIGSVPKTYREALYWDSPASAFFEVKGESKQKMRLHNVLEPADIPESFIEAHYDSAAPTASRHGGADFSMDHKFQIGVAPASYREALYWDSPASAFFELSSSPSEASYGEDFRRSPHGRTEDVNDPDYEINHPTNYKHSKNVIGTKQEGHLFWTDTVQPNEETYESSFDERQRKANTVSADEQSFSKSMEEIENEAQQLDCPDCPHTQYHH